MSSLTPTIAEQVLEDWLERTASPTKKLAGFRTQRGRELAIEREIQAVRIWAEAFNPDISGIEITNQKHPGQPYSAGQARSSNLNPKNAPRLSKEHRVFYLTVKSEAALRQFVDWYMQQ
jgi:hypothetical protein